LLLYWQHVLQGCVFISVQQQQQQLLRHECWLHHGCIIYAQLTQAGAALCVTRIVRETRNMVACYPSLMTAVTATTVPYTDCKASF
jgi:hypothetical protein